MRPEALTPSNLPHPAMSYSQAVRLGNMLFVAGQPSVNFETGTVAEDFDSQARQAFANLSAVLEASGSSMDRVAKTTVWLRDATNFDALNRLYAEYFPTNPPARSTPVVNLPRPNLMISIEAIAALD